MTRPYDILIRDRRAKREAFLFPLVPLLAGLAGIGISFLFPFSLVTLNIDILLTAAAAAGAYCGLMQYTLPYLHVRKLYASLSSSKIRFTEGTFLGASTATHPRGAIRMSSLKIDSGERIRGEAVAGEVSLPAIFCAKIPEGSPVRFETAEGVVTGIEPEAELSVSLKRGAYDPGRLVPFLILVFSGALWLTGWRITEKLSAPPSFDAAVCTLAYHEETEAVLLSALEKEGLRLSFAYSTTIDQETLYQYLATYGTFEADLILLPESAYRSAFSSETPVLIETDGFRYLANDSGAPVAAVLYDPDGDVPLPALFDWIAVPADEPYLLCLGPHADEGAEKAASRLLSALSEPVSPAD